MLEVLVDKSTTGNRCISVVLAAATGKIDPSDCEEGLSSNLGPKGLDRSDVMV